MILRLALRLLGREWRSGELRLLMIALVVAISASTAVGFFTDRVQQALSRQATSFLGADLVLRSAYPSALALRAEAERRGLQYSEQQLFSSMVFLGDEMLLVSIKAVDDTYPLRGQLKLADAPNSNPRTVTSAPPRGQLWAERRVLQSLQAAPGATLGIGISELQLSALLLHEPDRGGGLFSLRPRVLMNLADLPATELIQPGSRVRYRYLFSGEAEAIADLQHWLQPRLRPGERLLDVAQESPALGGTLRRAERYLNLSGLLALAMAAVAIAMTARRYTERHYDSAALLRSLGLRQRQLIRLFSLQLLMAGCAATLIGILLGWIAQQGLVTLLQSWLPAALPTPGWRPALLGAASGLLVLLATALPPLLQLASVPPLRVLRRELAPTPLSSWLVYLLAALVGLALLWLYSNDVELSLLIAVGALVTVALCAGVGWLMLRLLALLPGPLAWRLALKNLYRHPHATLSQLIAFGLTLAAMALILVVRTDLLRDWQASLPAEAPNHFLINIQPGEITPLANHFAERDIAHSAIYPMVRGRLSHINGQQATTLVAPDSPGWRGVRRELNLTWSRELPASNRLIDGRWWTPDSPEAQVSMESRLAADLGVGVGDRLRFSFGDRRLDATITSLRQLDWNSMRPNFFVIFSPGALDNLPATAITSFYLPPERSSELNQLLQRFPTFTLLEVGPLLATLRGVIIQVSLAVEYVLLFVLAAGVTVLFAGLANSIDARLQEGALLRTLGARSRLLRRMLASEFLLLGASAGLMAALIAQGATLWLYQLLELPTRLHPQLWWSAPMAGAVLVCLAGYSGTRRIIGQSPLRVLREDS